MPMEIARGEISDRIRRFFDVRGRLNTRLDEQIAPVTIIQDVSLPPYRTSPIVWAGFTSAPAVAAEFSVVAAALPVAPLGRFVVDQIIAGTGTAGVAAGVTVRYGATATLAATASNLSPLFMVTERYSAFNAINNNAQASGVQCFNGSDPGIPAGNELVRIVKPANESITINGPWEMPAGAAIEVWLRTGNVTLECAMRGRYWSDVP